jgi:hypothetical protein
MSKVEGHTGDVTKNFLGANLWSPEIRIRGTVLRKFDSANGECYALELEEPVQLLNGDATREAALGNLTGLRMAAQGRESKT